jgi:hypothetical protein
MTYLTKTLGKLSASHFLHCRSERLFLVDIEEGEDRPASPNFYETGNDLPVVSNWSRLKVEQVVKRATDRRYPNCGRMMHDTTGGYENAGVPEDCLDEGQTS